MPPEHWFDSLNRALVSPGSRRAAARTATALVAPRLLGGLPANQTDAAQERCSRSLCRRHFRTQEDREFCEIKCGRCRIREKFCIVHDASNKRATCCHEDQQCCQDTKLCCSLDSVCCPPSPNRVGCCPAGYECCASDTRGCCRQNETCCPGPSGGCVDTTSDDTHCGECGNACPSGTACVDGTCRPPDRPDCFDEDCPPGQRCRNRPGEEPACGCGEGFKYCDHQQGCAPDTWTCCPPPQSPIIACPPGSECTPNADGQTVWCRPLPSG